MEGPQRTRRLVQRDIDQVTKGDRSSRQILRDGEVRGFYVVIGATSIAYWFEYRPRGIDPETGRRYQMRHERIGDGGTHALVEARTAASALRRRVQEGGDPRRDKVEAAAAVERQRQTEAAVTAARLTCEDWLAVYPAALQNRRRRTTPRYQAEELRHVRLGLGLVGGLSLTPEELTFALVEKMLAASPVNTRSTRFGALDRFLSYAMKDSDKKPATKRYDSFERPMLPPPRKRVLSLGEIAALYRASEKLPNVEVRDLVQLIITLPCRRGEAAECKWADIDFEARTWHQPDSKNTDPHDFPLNKRAVEILTRRHKATGGHPDDLVFPGPRYGKVFCGWPNMIDAINARIAPETPVAAGWRLHDLRKSFNSILADLGHDEIVLDLQLNHRASKSRPGMHGRYQLSYRWDERVAALKAWGELLDRALGENVTPLRRRRTSA
jgi:integrase